MDKGGGGDVVSQDSNLTLCSHYTGITGCHVVLRGQTSDKFFQSVQEIEVEFVQLFLTTEIEQLFILKTIVADYGWK